MSQAPPCFLLAIGSIAHYSLLITHYLILFFRGQEEEAEALPRRHRREVHGAPTNRCRSAHPTRRKHEAQTRRDQAQAQAYPRQRPLRPVAPFFFVSIVRPSCPSC